MSIRTGGPNAGHTFEYDSLIYRLRSVPCAVVNPDCVLGLGAGALIDPVVLFQEIQVCKLGADRLTVDRQAGIIADVHIAAEIELQARVGSTGKGVGAALSSKVMRDASFQLARDFDPLRPYLGSVARRANDVLQRSGIVCLEGTQGFGLSLHHGEYPFVTSRDTTAAALCSDAGVSPRFVTEIFMVIRTYPIRSGGNSGPLLNEIDWATVTRESRSTKAIVERTTVTQRIRRVARFDLDIVTRAAEINHPTQIALMFTDYFDSSNQGKRQLASLSLATQDFIRSIERELNVPVTLVGTGPGQHDMIDMRKEKLGYALNSMTGHQTLG